MLWRVSIDCIYNSHDWQLGAFTISGGKIDPQRGGTQRTGAFPFGAFKSNDGYIGIGVFAEPQWEALARRMGREDLLEIAEFKTGGGRFANQDALKLIIEEWLATLPDDDEAVRISPMNCACLRRACFRLDNSPRIRF